MQNEPTGPHGPTAASTEPAYADHVGSPHLARDLETRMADEMGRRLGEWLAQQVRLEAAGGAR